MPVKEHLKVVEAHLTTFQNSGIINPDMEAAIQKDIKMLTILSNVIDKMMEEFGEEIMQSMPSRVEH